MHPGRPSIARRFSAPALLVLYGALAAGGVWERPTDYRWWHVLLAGGFFPLAVLLALGARSRLSQSRSLPLSWGAAVLILAHSAVQATGGADFSPLGPSLYLLLALLASLQSLPLALFNTLLCGGLLASDFLREGATEAVLPRLLGREVFYVLFSVGVGALIGWERSRRRRLESLVRHLRSDRDDLRQAGAAGDLPTEGTAAPATGTGPELARAIEGDLGGIARDLEKSFVSLLTRLSAMAPCRTCALYVRDGEGEHLRLREALSSQELDLDHRVAAGQGFIGWVFENGSPVLQKKFDSVRQRLPYYRSRQDVGSFLAVPVLAATGTGAEVVGGVLCADAPVEEALTEEHLKIFELAAGQVSEILSGARTLRRVREEKREFEGLYGFSAVLSGSLRAEELCAALLESAGKIVSFDLGAVVVRHAEAGGASVRVARGLGAEDLEGCPVAAKSSRAAWVLETGQTLHLAHRAISDTGPLLSPKEKLPAFESGVVVPLPSGSQEGVLGCLVLASRKERRLGAFELRLLELLGRQAGSVLLNARLFERMETLATRDGLTGLLNHRSFQERLDAELRRAQRTGASLCLALTDIDHFKKFNDTYGHPVGDAVLRHLAKLLSTGLRDIDVVARYGGEEFVLVLPETPLRKGLEVCERIRKKIERTALREQGHELSITISMGVAAYPEHAAAKGALIDAADKALYKAKHAGRNRALAWEPAEKYKNALRSLASAGKV